MRGIWKPLVVVLIGLAIGVYGFGRAHSDTVTCGDRTMYSGDECVHIGSGSGSGTLTYDDELAGKRRIGWIIVGVGGVIVLGSGLFLIWRIANNVADRRGLGALAAQRGWTYRRKWPSLLSDSLEACLDAKPTGWNVIQGKAELDAGEFTVFQCRRNSGWPRNACVIRLPFDVPGFRVLPRDEKDRITYGFVSRPDQRPVTGDAEFDKAYTVMAAQPQVMLALLTSDVRAYLLQRRLDFAVEGRWLVTAWDGRPSDTAELLPRVEKMTTLSKLLTFAVR